MSNFSINEQEQSESGIPIISYSDFPSLYQSSDQAAIQMQRKCFRFRLWYLIFLILASGVGSISSMIPNDYTIWLYVSMVIILLTGFVINLVSHVLKYDEKWFNCRAIAESVKTATWRYMMKSDPFKEDNLSGQEFTSKISEIRDHKQYVLKALVPYQDSEIELISNAMRNIREMNMADQRDFYVKFRLIDQKTWYTKKASSNNKAENYWFGISIAMQLFAIGLAIVQIAVTNVPINFVPILMTCAAAAVGWSQMKRHSELSQSYSIAAQELDELQTLSSNVTLEPEFCQFVNDVEYAISREHTMWCVRREIVDNQNNQSYL